MNSIRNLKAIRYASLTISVLSLCTLALGLILGVLKAFSVHPNNAGQVNGFSSGVPYWVVGIICFLILFIIGQRLKVQYITRKDELFSQGVPHWTSFHNTIDSLKSCATCAYSMVDTSHGGRLICSCKQKKCVHSGNEVTSEATMCDCYRDIHSALFDWQ